MRISYVIGVEHRIIAKTEPPGLNIYMYRIVVLREMTVISIIIMVTIMYKVATILFLATLPSSSHYLSIRRYINVIVGVYSRCSIEAGLVKYTSRITIW